MFDACFFALPLRRPWLWASKAVFGRNQSRYPPFAADRQRGEIHGDFCSPATL
jgi:hypothetical protein